MRALGHNDEYLYRFVGLTCFFLDCVPPFLHAPTELLGSPAGDLSNYDESLSLHVGASVAEVAPKPIRERLAVRDARMGSFCEKPVGRLYMQLLKWKYTELRS